MLPERLVLEVWTDGTMPPDEAVAQSAQVLIRHFELLTELVAKPAARFEKAPTSGEFVEKLPRTATGKLQKYVLRDKYWAGQTRRVN